MASINFLVDLERITIDNLHSLGFDPKPKEKLIDLLYSLFDINNKRPPILLWNIKYSKEIQQKSFPKNIESGLIDFVRKAKAGEDLKPHLSKNSERLGKPDFMFYDWGVFHFHLGIDPGENNLKFVGRTNELLFAIVEPGKPEMYLIDIYDHKSFADQNVLRVIENNWPKILDPYTLSRIKSLPINLSNEDIGIARKGCINSIIQTPGGRVFRSMGGGISRALQIYGMRV